MEAGLLAIAGGGRKLTAGDGKQAEEGLFGNGLLKDNPFKRIMDEALKQAGAAGDVPGSANADNSGNFPLKTMQLRTEIEVVTTQKLTDGVFQAGLFQLAPESAFSLQASDADASQAGEAVPGEGLWMLRNDPSLRFAALQQHTSLVQVTFTPADYESFTEQAGQVDAQSLASLRLLADRQPGEVEMLGGEKAAQWDSLFDQLQFWKEELQGDAFTEAGVPLISLSSMPLRQSWGQQLSQSGVASVQLVEMTQAGKQRISPDLVEALSQNDLNMLSDAEMAELDALIEQITRQGLQRQAQEGGFRQLLTEQSAASSADAALGTDGELSSLSASHQSQQTRPHDASPIRMMQAVPSMIAENGSPAEQLRVTITQAFQAGMDRVIVQLEPAELGRVDVRLDLSSDGRAQILIQADNRETLDLLQRDARLLERALQEAGIDADAQTMDFNLSQGRDEDEQSGTEDANQYVNELSPEVGGDAATSTMEPLTGHYTLSIAQGLDIKV